MLECLPISTFKSKCAQPRARPGAFGRFFKPEVRFYMFEHERFVELSSNAGTIGNRKLISINSITHEIRILALNALNALIETSRAGSAGVGFAVVAKEVKSVSHRITDISHEMSKELAVSISELNKVGMNMMTQLEEAGGQRLKNLALNMIDIIDRNLYERSCDVRWWATDGAVVEALQHSDPAKREFASERLAIILNSYTVYLDLWIADLEGNVVASGRPSPYTNVIGINVAKEAWFVDAVATASGDDYAAQNIEVTPLLGSQQVATYSTAVREGGRADGRVIGALGIFFDWGKQAAAVVNAVRLTPKKKGSHVACLSTGMGGSLPVPMAKAFCETSSTSEKVPVLRKRISTQQQTALPSGLQRRRVTRPTLAWDGTASSNSGHLGTRDLIRSSRSRRTTPGCSAPTISPPFGVVFKTPASARRTETQPARRSAKAQAR